MCSLERKNKIIKHRNNDKIIAEMWENVWCITWYNKHSKQNILMELLYRPNIKRLHPIRLNKKWIPKICKGWN